MQVAGIDLAWGMRARTGIALTDDEGALVRSATVTTDDEIADFLSGSAPAVIAIDAPIIVTNDQGMRDCERELSHDFRRFHAGTHPTNLTQASMQPQPRAWRLVTRHGWSTDIAVTPGARHPVALEVYPHSSMVGLFGLERVLAYKAKPGRAVESRRNEFVALLDHMEEHCDHSLRITANARWAELRAIVANATRQTDLNVIEDELDAIFCAYVAWTFATDADALVAYGSPAMGVIVTFPPPGLS